MKKKTKNKDNIVEIFSIPEELKEVKLPLFLTKIQAGFPSPAEDYIDQKLDLNEYAIKHPSATFFVRVNGESMINAGIYHDDLLIVDRSIQPQNNSIIIANLDGDLTVKRFSKKRNKYYLVAENKNFPDIEVNDERDFEVWGVATFVLHSLKNI